ncbi:MAG TPA: MFS transporter [Halanaerobiales bacterium]|nr:MFS transporter [Halanaerobiales bacterium]
MTTLSTTISKNKNSLKIFAAIGLCLLGDAMLYTVLPTRIELFAFSGAQLGIILAANRFIRLFSNFWAADLYKKFGRNVPFKMAVIFSILITFSYGYFELFWQFLILRLLWGIVYSLLRLKALLIIFDSGLPENMQGKLSGIFRSMSRSGYMVGMILGGYLTDMFSMSGSAYILAALTGLSLFFIFSKNQKEDLNKCKEKEFVPASKTHLLELITDFKMFILMFMGFALNFTGLGLINSSYGLYLKNIFGENLLVFGIVIGIATLNGIILSTQSLFELILSPFLGNTADKHSTHKLLDYAFYLHAILMSLLVFIQNGFIAIIIPLILFINTAFLIIILYIEVNKFQKSSVSNRMAGFTTAVDLGAAFGPLTLIFLDVGLTLSFLYLTSAILLFTAGLLYRLNFKTT